MSDLIFDVQNVIYRYNDVTEATEVTALDGLTLSVRKGQRVVILGANGSGKSTLLRLLDGLYFPESGTVSAFGVQLTEKQLANEKFAFEFRRRVGLVFQNPDVQLFNPTVFDEVAFGPLQLRWPKVEIYRCVAEALEIMGVAHLKDRSPYRLSSGEKKRVALASVLVLDPEVLLLDEPTSALDPKSQSQVIDFLVGWGGGAKTVVVTTHDLDIVEDIADHCCVFQHGRVVAEGSPGEILSDGQLLRQTNLIHSHRQNAHAKVGRREDAKKGSESVKRKNQT
ncbi:MAG: energy-coupling factor ABC transporter ATP-binding protein, partial [Pyrinomonadaceae bacterium]